MLDHYGFPRDYVLYPENNSITSIDFSINFWIKEFVIPDGVTNINDYAFRECTSLQKVYIPKSVAYIGEDAFYLSSAFTWAGNLDIYYQGTEAEWNAMSKYAADRDGWCGYNYKNPITMHFDAKPADMHQ